MSSPSTDEVRMYADEAIRNDCYFCKNRWGECQCDFPRTVDDEGEPLPGADEVDGFEHGGVWITRPNVSDCTRFFVDPPLYYGKDYDAWAERNADLVRRLTR